MKQASGWISRIRWQAALALLAGTLLIPTIMARGPTEAPAAAPTYTRLHAFAGAPTDGAHPSARLIQDSSGNLYGTTLIGGGSSACKGGCGTVFKVSPTRVETVLHSFSGGADGAVPYAGLIQDAAGNLYGTTVYGGGSTACSSGCGTIFKVSPGGAETVLYSFTGGADGANPEADLIQDAAGNLYGTTLGGGSSRCPGGCGVVFKLSPKGTETVLYSFTGRADGANPVAGLIHSAAGNFYGTAFLRGGPRTCPYGYGCGTVFELSPTGDETVLYTFTGGADGGNPEAALIRDTAGNFYGTTYNGGASGYGAVFKLNPSGNETVLYSFTRGADGANPHAGLIQDAAGNLYGTAVYGGLRVNACRGGCGTVFEVSPAGTETVLHSFTGGVDGSNPNAGLIQDAVGNLYGTASGGGLYSACQSGCGVVFKLTP